MDKLLAWGGAAVALGLCCGAALSARGTATAPLVGSQLPPAPIGPALLPQPAPRPWLSAQAIAPAHEKRGPALLRLPPRRHVLSFRDRVDERALSAERRGLLEELRGRFRQAALVHEAAPDCVKPEAAPTKGGPEMGEPAEPLIPGWEFSGASFDLDAPACSLDQKRLALAALASQEVADLASRSKSLYAQEDMRAAIYKDLWRQGLADTPEGLATLDAMAGQRRERLALERELLLQQMEALPGSQDSRFSGADRSRARDLRLAYGDLLERIDERLAPGVAEAQVRKRWADWGADHPFSAKADGP